MTDRMRRFHLVLAERAIERPYALAASLRIDRARMAIETRRHRLDLLDALVQEADRTQLRGEELANHLFLVATGYLHEPRRPQ